ncbi:MAG: neutral zinc metallopeptidase [Bacteroidota bacterium]
MLIRPGKGSDNLIDRRGGRRGRGGRVGIGLGGLLILLIGAFFGIDTSAFLGGGGTSTAGPIEASEPTDPAGEAVSAILAETELVWGRLYRESGEVYPEPDLVLFEGRTQTACGLGSAATGPFYCPADRTVYIDLSFFRQLQRMGARGDFPIAFVIAHEVAHHVQNVEGLLRGRRSNAESIQIELQADCLAGIWTHHAADEDGRIVLDASDIEEGISTADAVGDDRVQSQSGGGVRPETFTHGTSQQRVSAFLTGYRSGDYRVCFS